MRILILLLLFSLAFSSCKNKEETPDNTTTWRLDDHETGKALTYPNVFVESEEAVVVLGRLDKTYTVKEVQFILGGDTGDAFIELIIYRDKEDGDEFPGPILFQKQYKIAASDLFLQKIDLHSENVKVEGGGTIRVAIRFKYSGLPTIAVDKELDHPAKCLMNQQSNWIQSSLWNVSGDWVIRAVVE